jgi:hypothetical protein
MTDQAFLEAYVAISAEMARYCLTLDSKDWNGFADRFTDDVDFDMSFSGGGKFNNRAEAMAMVESSLTGAITAHQVHTPDIELNGDAAEVIWAMQDRVVFAPDRAKTIGFAGLTGYGHYRQSWVRQGGRWRISKHMLTRLHVDMQPLA